MCRRHLIVLCALTFIVACGPWAEAVQLKIATLAPDGSFWMTEARNGAAEIAERTAGRVTFRFYPGGTMGNENAVLRKMRIGQLHGAALLSGSLATIVPELEVYGLPLLFSSYDEVDYIRERFDPVLIERLAHEGYVCFGIIEGGFAFLMSSKPTRSFEDLEGQKAWMPEGDIIAQAILEAAGLSPIPLSLSDVLTGLQTGLIDTVAGPPVGAVALQWFTKVKYFTELPIVYTYGAVVVSERAFSRLEAGDNEIVREVLSRVSATLDRRTRQDNQEAKEALGGQGMEFVKVSPEGLGRWREVAAEATARLLAKGVVSAPMLAEVERLRQESRRSDSDKSDDG